MTITSESPATVVKHPRELVSAELFDKLVIYIIKNQSVTRPYAERVIDQTLVWLKACADNPGVRLAMSESVDPGWHAFILHSQEYAAFCDRMFGHYLHHVPPTAGASMGAATIARTPRALRATGYPVHEEHWSDNDYPCCPPGGDGPPPPSPDTAPNAASAL